MRRIKLLMGIREHPIIVSADTSTGPMDADSLTPDFGSDSGLWNDTLRILAAPGDSSGTDSLVREVVPDSGAGGIDDIP
jgi:hypothetical protein